MSLDLEVSSDRQRLDLSTENPVVREIAFATLDTRDIRSLSESSDLRSFISVWMLKVAGQAKSKKTAHAKKGE